MKSLRGVVLGDSQVKFLTRSRLRLSPSVDSCTFSFGGFDATRLSRAVGTMHFNRMDFAVVYVGGNDLSHFSADPQVISNNIKKLVLQIKEEVAPIVLVFKVLPRVYKRRNEDDALHGNLKRRSLNKKLKATLKRIPGVRILNTDHLFLDRHKQPKCNLFACDGYHVSRCRGIFTMAKIIEKALIAEYGPGVARADNHHREIYRVLHCSTCNANGHTTGACHHYCSSC